jgi:mono/diheme cytochrome c family protein
MAAAAFAALLAGCAARGTHASLTPPDPGKTAFQSYCAACHVANIPGSPAEAPPLDASPWVSGPEDRLIKIALQGIHGPIEVNGKIYNQEMPAVGQMLTDAQLASLLSFIRRQYAPGSATIEPAAVARVRAANKDRSDYWTAGELLKER